MGRKRKNSGEALLEKKRRQQGDNSNTNSQNLQLENLIRQHEALLEKLRRQQGDNSNTNSHALQRENLIRQHETQPEDVNIPTPQTNDDNLASSTIAVGTEQLKEGNWFKMGRKRKNSGEALLEKLRRQQGDNSNTNSQALQLENLIRQHETQPEDINIPTPRTNDDNLASSTIAVRTEQLKEGNWFKIGRKRWNSGEALSEKLRRPQGDNSNTNSQALQLENLIRQHETQPEDVNIPTPQTIDDNLASSTIAVGTEQLKEGNWFKMGRKRKNSGEKLLGKLQRQQGDNSNTNSQPLQLENLIRQHETQPEDVNIPTPQTNDDNLASSTFAVGTEQLKEGTWFKIGKKRRNSRQALLEKLRRQQGDRSSTNSQAFQLENQISQNETQHEDVNVPTPQTSGDNLASSLIAVGTEQPNEVPLPIKIIGNWFKMGKKGKNSGEALLEKLQGQQGDNSNTNSQALHPENQSSQHETQPEDVNFPTPQTSDDNLASSSIAYQLKDGPLHVKIIDTSTNEITIQKMTPKEVWLMSENLKVIVELNGDGHGEDNGSNLLVRFLGHLAQDPKLCPIHIKDWHWMPEEKKIQQWKYIEDYFMFDYAAGCKWVMRTLGERWRAYKYYLRRKYFYPAKGKKQLLANPPPGVDIDDWSAFVLHYQDKKMQDLSSQNKSNRKKLKVPHTGGSKSNARKACQMVKTLGRPVCRSEIVLSNLLRKDGSYVNDEGKILAAKISENLPRDQEEAATSGVPSKIFAKPDDAIGKVFGREHPGRVRGLGLGVSPSKFFGSQGCFDGSVRSNTVSNSVNEERIGELEKQVETLEEKLIGYEKTKADLASLYKFLQDKFGAELPTLDQDILSP